MFKREPDPTGYCDDETLEINLRTADEVAARCVVLATLLRRLWLESPSAEMNDEERAAEAFDLLAWLQTEGLFNVCTPDERWWFDHPTGSSAEQALRFAPLVAEGLSVLGWSLQIIPLPSPGDLSGIGALLEVVPAPWTPTPPWIAQAALQSEEEIAPEREKAELLAWRIGVEPFRRQGSEQQRSEYAHVVAETVREAILSGLAGDIRDGDFVFARIAIPAVDAGELDHLLDLAQQRLRALNWVCGFGATWDRVPLEV